VHVLIVPSWYPRDSTDITGVFFREQALALARAGHRVGVISPHFRSIKQFIRPRGAGPAFELDNGVTTYRSYAQHLTPGSSRSGAARWLNAGSALFDQYCAEQGVPDILHAHAALMGGVLALRLSMRSRVPYVVTEHSTLYARGALSTWQLDAAREVFAGAHERIVVSPQLGKVLESCVGSSVRPWTWVPNMVDSRFLSAPLRIPEPARPLRILNVALLTEKKGHGHLLRAFADAFGNSGKANLRIIGDGPLRSSLERVAEGLGVSDSVTFLGRMDREGVLQQMLDSDVFVLPSLVETFGVVVVEALACGIPVIATRSGGPECIVEDGDGLLVEPGATEQLAAAMLKVHGEISRYDPAEIRERCRARFGEKNVVARLEEIYRAAEGRAEDASSPPR